MYGENCIFMAIIFHKSVKKNKKEIMAEAVGCLLCKYEIKPCQSKTCLTSSSSIQIG
jgi:hypothetical protein